MLVNQGRCDIIINENDFDKKALSSIRRYVTVEEVADVLGMLEDRAQALLDDVIKFEAYEVYLLAVNNGMSYSEFIGINDEKR